MLQDGENGVDIIIPIYNGYEELKKCMESVCKYTNLSVHKVILIDDNSTDQRISGFLNKYIEMYKGVEVVFNAENVGFSANVNKGILLSDRDVILLNSDTIVTQNWVEKMKVCAYRKKEIATVTPLSNAATLCSVPIMCTDNPLPEGLSVDEMSTVVERVSLKKYPRITVAVGFCMYIKREVIARVGYFDEKTFGKGYGEENDFCNRAEQYGYIHVMCDDTFVFHKGTASFDTEEKRKLCEEHSKILEERYPSQMEKNHLYCKENPDQYIRDNLNIYLELSNGKKNLLYFLHSDFREDAGDNKGGTQFHVRDLVQSMKDVYNVFVLARDGENLFLSIYNGAKLEQFRFPIGEKKLYQKMFDAKIANVVDNIINAFEIDIVHVHHTYSLSLDVYYIASKHKIPLFVTLHDYYYVCPTIKLINNQGKFCSKNIHCSTQCTKCLAEQCEYSETVDIIEMWRDENEKALQLCNAIIVPTESAKETILEFFPSLEKRMRVIEHGENLPYSNSGKFIKENVADFSVQGSIDYCLDHPNQKNTISGWTYIEGINSSELDVYLKFMYRGKVLAIEKAEKNKRDDVALQGKKYLLSGFIFHTAGMQLNDGRISVSIVLKYRGRFYKSGISKNFDYKDNKINGKKLRVAFLGAGTREKGSMFIQQLVTDIEMDDIGFYLFGPSGDRELDKIHRSNYVAIGTYDKEKLYQAMKYYEIDVICILPIWAETFCYTLSEALLCGIPVIGTDIGAVGERIKKLGCGWTVSVGNVVDEVKKILKEIVKSSIILQEKRDILSRVKMRTLEQMLEDYINIYEEADALGCQYETFFSNYVFQGYKAVSKYIESDEVVLLRLGEEGVKARFKKKIKRSKMYKLLRRGK